MDLVLYKPITTKTIVNVIDCLHELFPGEKFLIEKKLEGGICWEGKQYKSIRFDLYKCPWIYGSDPYAEWKSMDEIILVPQAYGYAYSMPLIGNWTDNELHKVRKAFTSVTTRPEKKTNLDLIPLPTYISAIVVAFLIDEREIDELFSTAEIKAFRQHYFRGIPLRINEYGFIAWYHDWEYSIDFHWYIRIKCKDTIYQYEYGKEAIIKDHREIKIFPYIPPKLPMSIIKIFDRFNEFGLAKIYTLISAEDD